MLLIACGESAPEAAGSAPPISGAALDELQNKLRATLDRDFAGRRAERVRVERASDGSAGDRPRESGRRVGRGGVSAHMPRDLRGGLVDPDRRTIAGALPAARGSRRPLVRSVSGRARRKRRLALLACVTAIAGAAYGAEQDPEWIRPEAVPGPGRRAADRARRDEDPARDAREARRDPARLHGSRTAAR